MNYSDGDNYNSIRTRLEYKHLDSTTNTKNYYDASGRITQTIEIINDIATPAKTTISTTDIRKRDIFLMRQYPPPFLKAPC